MAGEGRLWGGKEYYRQYIIDSRSSTLGKTIALSSQIVTHLSKNAFSPLLRPLSIPHENPVITERRHQPTPDTSQIRIFTKKQRIFRCKLTAVNRTKVELKLNSAIAEAKATLTVNRTKVELKCVKGVYIGLLLYQLLIAPRWN